MTGDVFATALQQQLGSTQFVGKICGGSEDLFFSIQLTPGKPSLSAVLKSKGYDSCSLWEVALDDDRMTRHVSALPDYRLLSR